MATDSDSPAIGIDLGTTYCCVGVFQHGHVEIIANDHGSRTTPSCIVFDESQRLIGEAAKNMMAVNVTNSIYDAKRLIGRRFNDPVVQSDMQNVPFKVIEDRGKPKIQVNYKGETKAFLPEELSAMVLFKMKESAEVYLGKPVKNAVITVPSYFNDSQRRATKYAGKIAGFEGIRIMNEQTAAAFAFGYRMKDGKKRNVLIFDLGGGAFDVSVVTIQDGVLVVKSTTGNSHLGGEDFNSRMVKHFIGEFDKKYNKDVSKDKRALNSLRAACEKAKRSLSSTTQTSITIDSFYEGLDFSSSINRAKFEELNDDLFQSTIRIVQKTIKDAVIEKHQIDEVVLVGGSTRIPKIRMLLQDFFNGKELSKTINPDEAVAYGATIQAAILNGDRSTVLQNLLLHDVIPFSLGIFWPFLGGTTIDNWMIHRNTVIPTNFTKEFKFPCASQTDVMFKVYEVDNPVMLNKLGEFVLHKISSNPEDFVTFCITFAIQEDGILNISAVDKSKGDGGTNMILITNDETRLLEEEMNRIIADSESYRLDDEEQRKRAIARNDLELYCYDCKSKLNHCPNKATVLEMIELTILGLENGPLPTVEEMESKKKEIERLLNMNASHNISQALPVEEASITVPISGKQQQILPNGSQGSSESVTIPVEEETIIITSNSEQKNNNYCCLKRNSNV